MKYILEVTTDHYLLRNGIKREAHTNKRDHVGGVVGINTPSYKVIQNIQRYKSPCAR